MKFFPSFVPLILLFSLISILILLLSSLIHFPLGYFDCFYILTGTFVISLIILLVLAQGFRKGGKNSVQHTLFAISLKFLLYMLLIIGYYFLAKKLTPGFVLTFFIIYLLFTSSILLIAIRALKKNKPESR